MSLIELLRYIDIVLLFLLGGICLHATFLWVKPKTFAPSPVLFFILIVSLIAGSSAGGLDYIIGFQRSGSITFGSGGQVRQGTVDFGAYWDAPGTQLVNEVKWGSLFPGQTGNTTFYIKNQGDFPIYCEITTSTWQPVNASQFITLTWNFGGNPLDVSRSRKVTLQLKVSSAIKDITDFNFSIVIFAQDEPFTG